MKTWVGVLIAVLVILFIFIIYARSMLMFYVYSMRYNVFQIKDIKFGPSTDPSCTLATITLVKNDVDLDTLPGKSFNCKTLSMGDFTGVVDNHDPPGADGVFTLRTQCFSASFKKPTAVYKPDSHDIFYVV
jgi:hypothetical protein